ncbi:MAG: glycoside hydrolase family 2 TIM barrel-domain containing protein [Candidatus Acidiferrales bacterium]
MSPTNDDSGPLLTRRDLLAHAARGAMLVSASPYLARAQAALSPESSATRTRDTFDFGWKFQKGDFPGAQRPTFADASWRDVDLPHDWSIEGPFDEKAPSSGPGAYLPTGIAWYRKRFRVPEADRSRITVLEFDGVYQNSEVWINGQYLGLRPYGFIPFSYDLTPHLNFGGENVVAVRVDNSRQTNCRWYSGSGIDRHTWLLVTNPVRVAYWGTFVTTPRVSQQSATVQVKTRIANGQKDAAQFTLTTTILDKDGNTVQTAEASQEVDANAEYEFVQQLAVDKPSLWSPTNPYLYTVRSTVHQASQVLDVYDTPFGIREAIFDAERGFLLNGEHIKLNGACIHQEAGSVGSAVPERVWERRLQTLHEMGCNAIRTSHNPYPAEFLDLCDKMGFLVMNEAFDEWKVPKGQIKYGYSVYFDEWHERDATNFLHRDRNHPSVVLWSAGNEIPDQDVPMGVDTLRGLLDIFHTEDPTRLVTAACDHIAADPPVGGRVLPEFLALLDVVGYNYVDRWRDRAQKYYSIDHDAFPERRVVGTESGAMGGVRGDYRSLVGDPIPELPARFRFAPGRDVDVEQLWKFVGTYDYVTGDFMWTGIDYLGEAFWPTKGSSSGVIDTCGFKKDGFYFYQSQWTAAPMVHLYPHWNWAGKEGQLIPVTCYTNCDTVELFLNGKSLGVRGYEFPRYGMEGKWGNLPPRARTARTTGDLHLTWDVPYEPGTLKVVGTKDGVAAATMEISTTGEPAAIKLSVDRANIAADRRDVAHVTVEILDAQGRVVPDAASQVTFDVQGAGKIIGVDNGDPLSHEDFKSNQRKAFNGMCLAIVQSTATPGQIKIAASSPGLQSSDVSITTA